MGASKTPSSNDTLVTAVDELIDIITGGAEKEEHMLKQISGKLNKSTLGKIISEALTAQMEYLAASANMLCAIAGYLYGEKGVGIKSSAGELLGKVKNTAPILGEKPMSEVMAEGGGDSKKGGKDKDDKGYELTIFLEGISGGDVQHLANVINGLKQIAEADDAGDIDVIVDAVEVLDRLVKELAKVDFSQLDDKMVEKITDAGITIDELKRINKSLLKGVPVMMLLQSFEESIKEFPRIIAELISGTNGKGGLVMIMNRITKAQEAGLDVKNVTEFFNNVLELMKALTKIGLFAVIAGTFGKQILSATEILQDVIELISQIKINVIVEANKSVENAAIFVKSMRDIFVGLALVGLFALPAVVGTIVMMVASKLLFKVLKAVIDGINSLGDIKDIQMQFSSIGKLVLILGAMLLIGALIGGWVMEKAGNIIGFGLILGAFVFLILLPFILFSRWGGKAIENAQEMGYLIAICAGVMILGAIFMMSGLWKESLLFGAVLMAFMFGVFLPFIFLSKFMRKTLKNVKEMGYLIVMCALTMMLGAAFMKLGLWKESLKFGAILMGFMMAVFLPFILLSMFMKKAVKNAKQMIMLIVTCALVLMIGALFMKTGLWLEALIFAGILGLFIFLVVLPFGLFGKKLQKAMPSLLALTLLIIVSTIVLIIGANYIKNNGYENALIFAGLIVGFIAVLGIAAWILAQIQKDVFKGLLVIACIVAIVGLFTIILGEIADIMNTCDVDKMFIAVGVIAAIIVALGALSVAMGALTLIPFFWMGLAAVAAVAGIALILSVSLKNIAEAAKTLAEANNLGFDPAGAMAIIGSMVSIGAAVGGAAVTLPTGLILFASISFMAMAKMISMIGIAVADMSNLKVATEWDSNGNGKKFRQLNKTDFENAATNTEIIITTLGGAITKTYNDNPDLFKTPAKGGIAGFFGATETSPFDKVVRSCTGLGRMISMIAEGVANMANLTVATAWNENGQPTKFRTLKYKDFKAAADNIKEIVETLGGAICTIYKDNKELFEVPDVVVRVGFIKITKSGSGPTVFEKVVKACSSLGQMISSIAAGVGDMASLKVADQWNSEGAPIHYRYLQSKDFELAGQNVSEIVKTLGAALKQTYVDNEDMFSTSLTFVDGKLQGDTPIIRVINAGRSMGEMVSSIAAGVQDIANLRMPIKWDKDGQPCDWREMTEEDFTLAGQRVSAITSVLSEALAKTYRDNPGLFDPVTTMVKTKDGWFSDEYTTHTEDAPMVKVLKAAGGLGKFVGECAQAVKEVGDLSFEDKDGKKVQIKAGDLTQTGYIAKNVKSIVTCLPGALSAAYKELPDGTLSDAQYFNDSLLPAIAGVTEQYSQIVTKNSEVKAEAIEKGVNNFTNAITGLLKVFKNEDTMIDDTFKQTLSAVKSSIEEIKGIEINEELFTVVEDINKFAKKLEKIKFNIETKNIAGLSLAINGVLKPFASRKNKPNVKTIAGFGLIVKPENLVGMEKLIKVVNQVNTTADKVKLFSGILKATIKAYDRKTKLNNILNIKAILSKENVAVLSSLVKLTYLVKEDVVENFKNFVKDVATSFKKLGNTKIKYNNVKNFNKSVLEISAFAKNFYKVFGESFDTHVENFKLLVTGVVAPFESITIKDIAKYKATFSETTTRNVNVLTKSVNALNNDKVDKFIELSQELRELSETVGDIGGLVDALNGRINETLTKLSESLENASDTIKESDKVQDKRQKLIQKNTKELQKVMSQPMKLELSKAASASAGSRKGGGGGSSSGGGSSTSGGSGRSGGLGDTSGIEELLIQIRDAIKAL